MATRGVGEIPSLSQLYRDSESDLSGAALSAKREPDYPASESINKRIGLIRGDITKLRLDAVVNAANKSLLGGGGVDGAIHRAAGPRLVRECRPLGPINTGEAVITKGYNLPAKHVIHTVGPVYDTDPNPKESLANCYRESLRVAVTNNLTSVAFSAISTGIYGFPSSSAAKIACKTVREFLETEEGNTLSKVVFVTFVPPDVDAYNEALPRVFPPAEEGPQSEDET
ncbi:RNA-directed RNA polymerase [Fusarium acuminatum]